MAFEFQKKEIEGVYLIKPPVFPDARGFFAETYKASVFRDAGIDVRFVQSNHSQSRKGTIRGLHFQRPPKGQAKLVRCISGEIFDVIVDVRAGSPTFGRWIGERLSAENKLMFYVPEGFAHGFSVLSDEAQILYSCSSEYAPEAEAGVSWDDPDLGIDWQVTDPIVSEKDRKLPRLKEIESGFQYLSK